MRLLRLLIASGLLTFERESYCLVLNISVNLETGGFNLEFAWSSGYLAGTAIAGAVLASCTAGTKHGQNLEHFWKDERMNI